MTVQITTLFQNQHFLAVDKPHGWLSVPSRLGKDDKRPCLGKTLEEMTNARIWPVHRLDFEVSGLILFAKSASAHKEANRWFEDHSVVKTYEAWTLLPETLPKPGEMELWQSMLVKGKKRAFEAEHGKASTTQATLIGTQKVSGKHIAIWHLQPLTGRSHQLRFELHKHQCPVLGDRLYGSDVSMSESKIALRSIELNFSRCGNRGSFDLPDILRATPDNPETILPGI